MKSLVRYAYNCYSVTGSGAAGVRYQTKIGEEIGQIENQHHLVIIDTIVFVPSSSGRVRYLGPG